MAIGRFIGDGSFSPEVVFAMTTAFDEALRTLNLADRNDPQAEIVARKIIEIARRGEHDSSRLVALAIGGIQQ